MNTFSKKRKTKKAFSKWEEAYSFCFFFCWSFFFFFFFLSFTIQLKNLNHFNFHMRLTKCNNSGIKGTKEKQNKREKRLPPETKKKTCQVLIDKALLDNLFLLTLGSSVFPSIHQKQRRKQPLYSHKSKYFIKHSLRHCFCKKQKREETSTRNKKKKKKKKK